MKLAVYFTAFLPCFSYSTGIGLPATGSRGDLTNNLQSLIQCVSMTLSNGEDPEVFCVPQVKFRFFPSIDLNLF